jgi:hypothetical protein
MQVCPNYINNSLTPSILGVLCHGFLNRAITASETRMSFVPRQSRIHGKLALKSFCVWVYPGILEALHEVRIYLPAPHGA